MPSSLLTLSEFVNTVETLSTIRNLDRFNPVVLKIAHPLSGVEYHVIASVEPPTSLLVPINGIWVNLNSESVDYRKVFKAVTFNSLGVPTYVQVTSYEDIFVDPQVFNLPTGPKGDQGDPGPAGAPGSQGLPGTIGPAGSVGPAGAQGIQGNPGAMGPAGPQGLQGLQGLQGPQGPAGATGTQGLQGIQGIKGDTGNTGAQGPQGVAGSPGVAGTNGAAGAQGVAGTAGSVIRTGMTAPSDSLGVNTDFYVDVFLGDVYTKTSGIYVLQGNIKGPPGDTGAIGAAGSNGTNGTDGAPGSVWRQGSGVPSDAIGIDGDYYIDTLTSDVYLRTAGTYSIVTNLKGDVGATGPALTLFKPTKAALDAIVSTLIIGQVVQAYDEGNNGYLTQWEVADAGGGIKTLTSPYVFLPADTTAGTINVLVRPVDDASSLSAVTDKAYVISQVTKRVVDPRLTVTENVTTDPQHPTEITLDNASPIALTIQPFSTTPIPVGVDIPLFQLGAGQVTITPGVGVTLHSTGGKTKLTGQYSRAILSQLATDLWILSGDIST